VKWNGVQSKDAPRRLSNPFLDLRPGAGRIAPEEGGLSLRRVCPFALLVLLACGTDAPSRPPVASISLTPASAAPFTSLGDTLLLSAVPLDAQGNPIPGVAIAYSSSDATVATVTQGGAVTAVANGSATIHAAAEGKEATLAVTVAQAVAQVIVTPTAVRVPPGETPLFHASAVDARGNPVAGAPAPVWSTTDASLATIAADGRATVSAGATDGATASAIATIGSTSSAAGGLMTVDSTAIYVETITVGSSGPTSFSSLNEMVQLSATATNPRLGDVSGSVTFAWSSSAPGVASVSSAGLVTAVGNGTAAVSASWNGVSGSQAISVAQVVASVSVATQAGQSSASLASLGQTVQLVATAKDAGGSPVAGASLSWTSDAPQVATVSPAGLVTAVANGSAHVVARATSNQVASPALAVAVQQVVATVSVVPSTISIPRCTTQQFAATARDALGNAVAGAPAPTWSSAQASIATVDSTGLARGAAVGGPVAIRATIGGVTGSAQLTVNSSPITVNWNQSAVGSPLSITTCAGQSIVFHNTDTNLPHTATGTPAPPPDTGDIQPGASSAAQLFSTAGQYHFLCIYHGESGTVVVTP
jgi:plastocyanin